ncbi:MAG: hypothetical protein M3R07_11340, partial [Gemmatimonadota bacterium]|nr:hypothetical protein [Gemmatimonadota bacterium]
MTVHIIGWAIIHSVWQVGLLAAGAALAFFICRRSAPAVRYAVGLGFLLLMAGLPVATAWRMGSTSPAAPEFQPAAASDGNLPPIGFNRGSKDAGATASTASAPGSATGSFDVET